MRFLLQNIGVIESADIKVEGLTVIAGLNNVGKSYIGKTIFAAVKAAKESYMLGAENIHSFLTDMVREISNTSKFDFLAIKQELLEKLGLIIADTSDFVVSFQHQGLHELNEKLKTVTFSFQLKPFFKKLEMVLAETTHSIHETYNFFLKSLFKNEYNNKSKWDSEAVLTCLKNKDDMILKVSTSQNRVKNCTVTYLLGEYSNATLIESPIVLELAAFLRDNLAFGEKQRDYMPYHFFDLIKKIILNRYAPDNNEVWTKKINEIIGGDIAFNKTTDNFTYTDVEGKQFDISNVASGIKSFALLQLLLKGEHSKETLLIIDEPEVHLHLEWQMRYAKLLVELAKEGFPILLTSHSPYFIEALKVYSDNAKIADKTHFYLGEMKENGAVFTEVSQNLDAIFEKFSAPMIKLSAEH